MKIYIEKFLIPTDEEVIENLLKVINIKNECKKILSEENYKKLVIELHEIIRNEYNLPDKIFTIVRDNNMNNIAIVFFNKKPDGKYYYVEQDENGYYINTD